MMKIIVVTGRNRAGKTTLAKTLANDMELNGFVVEYYPFAQPLKEELVQSGFDWFYLKKKSQKARRLMQAYGDAKREIEPDYFLKKWEARVERAAKSGVEFFISDDLYHWKELNSLCKYATKGGFDVTVVLVNRPSLPELTEEDFKYDSVREQQEIEEKIVNKNGISCKTGTPYKTKMQFIRVINDADTVRDFVNTQIAVVSALIK